MLSDSCAEFVRGFENLVKELREDAERYAHANANPNARFHSGHR